MRSHPLSEKLRMHTLLFDGAMGTYARTIPGFPEGPVETACLTAPEAVASVHRAYLQAGCHAIKTNTFAAHAGLASKDTEEQKRIVAAAYGLAVQEAAAYGAYVFADIGPVPSGTDPAQAYGTMADAFAELGAECFLLETLPSFAGVAQTVQRIRQRVPQAYILVSFAVNPDGYTHTGDHARKLLCEADACFGIDAVGLNCVCGAYHMQKILHMAAQNIRKPISVMPNAGYPHIVDGRMLYDSDPVYYGAQAAGCAAYGARIFGGCCGTTPEHIKALRQALRRMPAQTGSKEQRGLDDTGGCQSPLKEKLECGERVVLVELDPPANTDVSRFLRGAMKLKAEGADAITIADCPIGRASMDSSMLASKLVREYGIDALPHLTCRDRNVNATKALLLGLSMEGVHQVLIVTGDPVPNSDRDSVKSVFQFNSRMLARFIRGLEPGVGPFFLCGALNINAASFEQELKRAVDKEACGIEAFLTQPVLSRRAIENLKLARKTLKGRIFGGLFPVVSHRNAEFLQSEVSGIVLDDDVIHAYDGLDRAQGEDMAVRLCCDAANAMSPYVNGFYIMTPFQRVELVCRVLRSIADVI